MLVSFRLGFYIIRVIEYIYIIIENFERMIYFDSKVNVVRGINNI